MRFDRDEKETRAGGAQDQVRLQEVRDDREQLRTSL